MSSLYFHKSRKLSQSESVWENKVWIFSIRYLRLCSRLRDGDNGCIVALHLPLPSYFSFTTVPLTPHKKPPLRHFQILISQCDQAWSNCYEKVYSSRMLLRVNVCSWRDVKSIWWIGSYMVLSLSLLYLEMTWFPMETRGTESYYCISLIKLQSSWLILTKSDRGKSLRDHFLQAVQGRWSRREARPLRQAVSRTILLK